MTVKVTESDRMQIVTVLSTGGILAAFVLLAIGGSPIDLPMPTHAVGWVEPTCGLTRGSVAILRGDLATAFRYNPLSFLVVAFGLLGLVRALVGWTFGRWIDIRVRVPRPSFVVLGVMIVLFWLHQQTNADFIINSRI